MALVALDSVQIFGEVPSGLINGANNVFTTGSKFVNGAERMLYNGARLVPGVGEDYTTSESGGVGTGYDTITFVRPTPPRAGDKILVDYVRA